MSKIKIAICDDAAYWCDFFENAVKYTTDIELLGTSRTAKECKSLIEKSRPDILLLDIQLDSDTEGLEILPDIFKIMPDLKVIMLTSFDDEDYIFSAFSQGISDYLLKSASIEEMFVAIRDVYSNTTRLRPSTANIITRKAKEIQENQDSLLYIFNKMINLSAYEFDVLKSLYYGKTIKDIASYRVIEESSVRRTISRIVAKFDANSTKELLKHLHELKVFELFKE